MTPLIIFPPTHMSLTIYYYFAHFPLGLLSHCGYLISAWVASVASKQAVVPYYCVLEVRLATSNALGTLQGNRILASPPLLSVLITNR
jgi:hypothetical protein